MYRSLSSDALEIDQDLIDRHIDTVSERLAFNLSNALAAGSKASLKISFKGQLAGNVKGYCKSSYEKEGKTKYYALTQFAVSYAPSRRKCDVFTCLIAYCCSPCITLLG
jgi:aminopeptidase 2